jgi:hypothetical protein
VAAAPAAGADHRKGLVSDRVVIDTVVAKYSDHLPLYRQSVILEREAGVEIGRATMDGWVMRVGELLIPIVAVMGRELLGGSYIQADETPVDVQLHDGRGQNHQAYLWQYGRPGGGVVFDFRLGRGREGPKDFWDSSKAFCRPTAMALTIAWAGRRWCMPDAGRIRGGSSSMRSNSTPDDAVATRIVARIDELFGIDALAREEKLDHAARHAASGAGQAIAGGNPRGSRGSPRRFLAFQCVGEGGELHTLALAEAHALPGASRVGTEQQPGGELDASDAGAVQFSYFGSLKPCAHRPTQSLAIHSSVGQSERPVFWAFGERHSAWPPTILFAQGRLHPTTRRATPESGCPFAPPDAASTHPAARRASRSDARQAGSPTTASGSVAGPRRGGGSCW